MKNVFYSIVFAIFIVAMQSCFKGDDRIAPHVPGDETLISIKNSVYDNQLYFDFSTAQFTAEHPNDSWVLALDASPEGWEVNINSGNLLAVAPTGKYEFNDVLSITKSSAYHFDASDGNPDSSAFSGWIDREMIPWQHTGEIFLVGQYDGIRYNPLWKIRIDSVNDKCYTVTWSGLNSDPVTTTVEKDASVNFVHVTIDDSLYSVNIEPPKTDWDILFSQYGTILYTDTGEPTPYFVRGVLLNPYKLQGALVPDNLTFDSLRYENIDQLTFTDRKDLIGYDWKDPVIDFQANTVIYYVRLDTTYVIHDNQDMYFKLRFVNFYNEEGLIGYPEFEFLQL